MAGPWEQYQQPEQSQQPPAAVKAKPWEQFQYSNIPADNGQEEKIWDNQRSVVFTAPRGTANFFATVSQDDTFDDQPDSTIFEEFAAGTEAQAAYLGLTALAVGAAQPEDLAGFISSRKKALASAQARQPEYMKRFYEDFNQADGVFSAAGVIVDNLPAVGRVTLTQSANAFMPLVAGGGGALAGSPAGPLGALGGGAAGAFIGGSAVEVGAELDALLLEKGYDTSKAQDLIRLSEDKETLDALREKALAKGLTTAGVDAVFTVVTAGVFKALKPVTKVGKVAKAGAGFATETIGEGVSEGAGQLAAYGEMSSKDVLLEMVSSMGQSAGQTAIAGTITGAQKAQSVVFKAEQASQKLEQATTPEETSQAMQEMIDVEAELDQAYEAAVYERGQPDQDLEAPPRAMAMEAEKPAEVAQEIPDIEFADGVDAETLDIEAEIQSAQLPERSSRIKTFAKDFGIKTKDTADRYIAPISTRIKNISPKLFSRVRRFEFDTKRQILSDNEQIGGFLKKYRALPTDAKVALDLAMKNGNQDAVNAIAGQYNMQQEIATLRETLDNIFQRTQDVSMETEYRENFYPRFLKDYDKFMDYMQENQEGTFNAIDKAIKEKEASMKRPMTEADKIRVIDNLMLGRKVEGISLATRGELKNRTVDVIDTELNRFYADTGESLLHYIHVVNEAIETNRLFGREGREFSYDTDPQRSVGDLVDEIMGEEGLSNRDARLLKEMLNARFNPGRMSEGMAIFRDLSYIDVMGSPLNAITQFGDLAPSIYNAGVMRVAQTLPGAAIDRTKINLTDLGIDDKIAQEFDNHGWSSRMVNEVFKRTGLQKVDRLGKLTLVNSTLKKHIAQAKKNDKSLNKKLELHFGDRAEQVRQDLIDGNITEDVRFLAFNTLLDVQPVARSEVPQGYLEAKNGKIFYILKTFTIKQLDLYRREGLQNIDKGIRQGDAKLVTKGLTNFAYLYALWVMSGATADALKDLTRSFFGDSEMEEPEDYIIENMYKGFGLNKYSVDMMNRPFMPDTPADFAFEYALPPTKLIDNTWRDYQKIQKKDNIEAKDLRSIRSIPLGGELYWFWFGGGSGGDKKKNSNKSKY